MTGKNGASQVFGPQKGATPEIVEVLDKNLGHWADLVGEKALAGSIGLGIEVLYEHGITSVNSIVNTPMTLEEAISRGCGIT